MKCQITYEKKLPVCYEFGLLGTLSYQSAWDELNCTQIHKECRSPEGISGWSRRRACIAADERLSVEGCRLPQDLLYDKRSQYWDKRVLRRLESLDEDENDAEAKDSKADKDDGDDEDYSIDKDKEDELERRREYWSRRLDKDW